MSQGLQSSAITGAMFVQQPSRRMEFWRAFLKKQGHEEHVPPIMGPNESIKSGSGLNHPSQHRFYLQIDILIQFMITYWSQGTILYFPRRKIFESAAVSPPRKHFGICAGTFWDGNWPVVWFSIQHISILHTIRQVIWQIRPHKLLCKSSETSLEILTSILLIICHIFSHVIDKSNK